VRFSALFLQTLREASAEAELAGHRLLARAGFLQPIAGGAFGWLPLAARSLARLQALALAELESLGGQEIILPEAGPQEAEALAELARRTIRSYRQLPRLLFTRASLPGPEPAGRLGPLGARGFPEIRVFDLQPDEPGQEASCGPPGSKRCTTIGRRARGSSSQTPT
jgi:hypothetical protein